jgi:hypothetical protein
MGIEPLDAEEVGLATLGWRQETPLWYYVLREAHALEDGNRLGPVGGRIVSEVLLGILDGDSASYRAVDPGWTPTLADGGGFGLGELLARVS